jgi:hypothetical protein
VTFKARQCYVIVREQEDENVKLIDKIPVAVFYDLETAEGNAEGYNLAMEEGNVLGVKFYVAVTVAYE